MRHQAAPFDADPWFDKEEEEEADRLSANLNQLNLK